MRDDLGTWHADGVFMESGDINCFAITCWPPIGEVNALHVVERSSGMESILDFVENDIVLDAVVGYVRATPREM
jgi:hypothetical protein